VLASAGGVEFGAEHGAEVKLWDPGTRQPLGDVAVSGSVVDGLDFSPDGGLLVTASTSQPDLSENRVELWDVRTHQNVRGFPFTGGRINSLAFSPNSTSVWIAGTEGLKVWDTAAGQQSLVSVGVPKESTRLAFSQDGKLLATGGVDRVVLLWDPASKKELGALRGHKDRIFSLAFAPDGRTLASACPDGTVKLWNVASKREVASFDLPDATSVAFSNDGRWFAAAGNDGSIRLWSAPTFEETDPKP
jgi:WD40 repeat protein